MAISIFILYIVLIIGVGIYCRRYTTTLEGFFVGARNLGPWLLGLAYFSTYFSSSVMVGNVGVGYKAGLSWFFMPILQTLALPVGLLIFAEGLRKTSKQLGIVTVPDYMRERYLNTFPAAFLAVVMIIFLMPYMVAVTKGAAVVVQTITGIPYFWSVWIVIGVTGAYVILGGFMSGVITDFAQALWMAAGALVTFVVALVYVGGPAAVATKLKALNPVLIETPGTLGWSGLFALSFVFGIAPWGLPQLVQKCFGMRDRRVVRPASIILVVMAFLILYTSNGNGIFARAIFGNELLNNPDYAFPKLVVALLPPILQGFILAAVAAAAMSTLDGVILVAAGAFARDLYQRIINPKAGDHVVLRINTVVLVILTIVTGYFSLRPPPLLLYLTVFSHSVLATSVMAPLFYGIYYRRATAGGCIASQIAGVAMVLIWFQLKQPFGIHPFLVGLVVSLIVFPIVSKLTAPLPQDFVTRIFPVKTNQ
jgi:SSS family solute:Na+ symporter